MGTNRNLVPAEHTAYCRTCGLLIAFMKSRRTGTSYPVDVLRDGATGILMTTPFAFHKCAPPGTAAKVWGESAAHGDCLTKEDM